MDFLIFCLIFFGSFSLIYLIVCYSPKNKTTNSHLDKIRLPVKNGFARLSLPRATHYQYWPSEYVAFDVETASSQPFSICQIAFIKVKDGIIIDKYSTYIKPPEMVFTNTKIHGISAATVANSPTLDQVWDTICNFIDAKPLVAHNANFDIGCLIHTLMAYELELPEEWPEGLLYLDTLQLAKATWENLDNYKLPTIAQYLGLSLNHHDAMNDAEVVVAIMEQAKQENRYPPTVKLILGNERKSSRIEHIKQYASRKRFLSFEILKRELPHGYTEADFVKDFIDSHIFEDVSHRVYFEKMKVAELKELLLEHGITGKGKKADLVTLALNLLSDKVKIRNKFYQISSKEID